MEHSRHDLQSSSREVGEHQVLLSGGSQESVLPPQPLVDTQWDHSLCQASGSSGQGHGEGITGDDSEHLHSKVQVQHQEDCFPHSLGEGERDLVVGSDSGRVCHVPENCTNLEKYPSGNGLIRLGVGEYPLWPGDVRHVGRDGHQEGHSSQGVARFRYFSQSKSSLSERQASHVACRQSECQTGLHQPGHCKGLVAVQEGCGASAAVTRTPDFGSSSLCEISTPSSRGLSQQKASSPRLAASARARKQDICSFRSARGRSDGDLPVHSAGQLLLPPLGRGSLGCGQLGPGLGQVQTELCVPSSSHDRTCSEQDLSMQLQDSVSSSHSLETSINMVSKGSASISTSSSQATSQSAVSAGSSSVNMSTSHTLWEGDEIRRVEAFWWGRSQSGRLSSGAQLLIQSSWAKGTKSVYGLGFRYFSEFCKKHKLDPFAPDPVNLINFLTYFYEVKKSEYRTLNCYRSAISSTLAPDPRTGLPVGQDPLVCRFFKGIRRLRPPKTKLFPTWSVSSVLFYLKSLGGSKSLDLSTLLKKTCFLVALVCCKRPACLYNMQKVQGYWDLSMSGLRCQTLGMSKTEMHHVAPPISIEPFLEDPALCPVYHLVRLDRKLDKLRGKDEVRFWISSKKPHKPVSTQTICNWLSSIIIASGAVSGTARDVRSVGSSTAMQAGMDLGRILQAADWRRVSTFQRHYFKPQKLDCISNILKVGKL